LTRTEISILKQIDGKLQSYLDGNFRLVELGSGSSQKTRLLIDMLTRLQKHVEYFPIDISKILKSSSIALQSDYKKLHITGIIDNYENGLEFVKNYDDMKNLIVFLGSSFGNFDPENGIKFLQKINSSMKKGDLFLVGLDLVKDKDVLYQAYNDSQGITAQFNLNVLSRINSELGGNFDTSKFVHHAVYNENQNKIELYLRSLSKQTVEIPNADLMLKIDEDELIHTETSHKYTISQIKQMFTITGYQIKDMWNDDNRYYSLVLLSKN
jgi:dimethylhistidine N-methyltransferase